jgi:hypothetical protein
VEGKVNQLKLCNLDNNLQDRPTGTSWAPYNQVIQKLALLDEVKNSLYKTMNVFFKPILHDKNVLALTFLMVIFAQEETEYNQEVGRMVSQYWILLRRHLTNAHCEDIEEFACANGGPRLPSAHA